MYVPGGVGPSGPEKGRASANRVTVAGQRFRHQRTRVCFLLFALSLIVSA